jgi:hypothetical protein
MGAAASQENVDVYIPGIPLYLQLTLITIQVPRCATAAARLLFDQVPPLGLATIFAPRHV